LKDGWKRDLETEHLCRWEPCEGDLRWGTLLLGTPKDMPSRALEMGICFHRTRLGESWGTWGDAPFLGLSKEGWSLFILGEIYIRRNLN
jgi:hypothetical protein